MSNIASALATRFDVSIAIVKRHLRASQIEEWGGIRRVDSSAGDTMRTSLLGASCDDARDATYVRVRCLFVISAPLNWTDSASLSMNCLLINMPDRHVVSLNTSSRHFMVNCNVSTPFASQGLAKISDSTRPSPSYWRLSGAALSTRAIANCKTLTFDTTQVRAPLTWST
jgi:hypothetical protein